jgi:hypothetical protein
MAEKYTYLITDFLNDAAYVGGLQQEIEGSSITTPLSYIIANPITCNIYFESTLSAPEITTLDGLVAAHDGYEPMVEPGLVLSPDGKGSYDWDNITVISGAVHYLDMLNFIEKIYEDITTVSGSIEDIQEAVTTLSGAAQVSFDEIYDTITVTSGTLQDQIDGITVSGTGTDTKVFDFAVRDASKEYFEVNSLDWLVVISFPFPGTDEADASQFSIVASRPATAGQGECRLYDYTNDTTVSTLTWTATEKVIYTDSSLENLPPSEALFEVQIRKQFDNQADKARIHSCVLR